MPRPMCKWNREGDVAEKKENEAGWKKETEMRTVKSQKETESWGAQLPFGENSLLRSRTLPVLGFPSPNHPNKSLFFPEIT